MGILARLVVLLPLALSIVGIVLSSLCLFAGRDTGFMEDYDIVRLNVSRIGRDLIPWDEIDSGDLIDNIRDNFKRGLRDDLKDKFDDAKDDVKGKLDDIEDDIKDKGDELTNDVIDRVTDALDISDWYSLHVMSACHGYWEPNATEPSPSLNISGCSTSSPTYRLNLTEMIDQELRLGDLGINLSDIDWPDEIQDKLDLINDLLLAIFIVYVIGMGFCGLAVLGCLGSLIFASSRAMVLINFILAGLGALALTVGSVIVTVAGTKGVDEFNDRANDIGISARRGRNFLIISWVAAGCMILAAIFWTTRFCVLCVQRRRDRKIVAHKGDYYEKAGYSRRTGGRSKWGRAFGGIGNGVGHGVGDGHGGGGDGSS